MQRTLMAVWKRGSEWHEGRIVLELRSQCSNARRGAKTRRAREDDFAYITCQNALEGEHDDSSPQEE